jgi:hypothetical protein
MKVTDPGSLPDAPLPHGAYLCLSPTRVRILLFSSRTEKPKSTLQSQCFSVSGYAGWLE